MNEKVSNKIEEYNTGGLFHESLTYSPNVDPLDAATLVHLFTSSTGTGFGSFSLPKEKTVDLTVEQAFDTGLIHDDPAGMDQYVRDALARELAKKLIEEDIIQIQSCEDMEHLNTVFRAKVKVVQE